MGGEEGREGEVRRIEAIYHSSLITLHLAVSVNYGIMQAMLIMASCKQC